MGQIKLDPGGIVHKNGANEINEIITLHIDDIKVGNDI
jgi:hypothetical protein